MTSGPSQAYHNAVLEGARHHAGSKTYSGSFLRPHKPFLSAVIARLACTSAIDVGAGKGVQYEWVDPADGLTIEQAWGFEVAKFDPCWPPFAAEPAGKFDLVICTHTASVIPEGDLDWFLARLFERASKAVFIAEKIGERKKGEVADPHNRAIGWTRGQWIDRLKMIAKQYPHIECVLSTRERDPAGKVTTRHTWRDGVLVDVEVVEPVNA